MMLTATLCLVFLILGFFGQATLDLLVSYLQVRKARGLLIPSDVDNTKLCKQPHSWITTTAITDKGRVETQLCRICGLLSGTDKMASQDTIDVIEEQNRVRAVETKIYKEFIEQEDENIKKYFDEEIKKGMNYTKLNYIHTAGMTFRTRYQMYKMSKTEDMERELNRSNS